MKYGFFDSVITGYQDNGMPIFDRAVDAEFLSKKDKTFFSNGIVPNPSTSFQVVASSTGGMKVEVKPGFCIIEGHSAFEESQRTLTFQASESLDRIDRVVLRLNKAIRTIDLYVVKGTAATSPQAPALNRPIHNQSGDIYELGIANVFIARNTGSITQSRITDTRMNTNDCGLVVSPLTHLDTSNLYLQYQASLDEYMNTVRNAINGTLAGQLQTKINDRKPIVLKNQVLNSNYSWQSVSKQNWDSKSEYLFRQKVNVSGMTSNDKIIDYIIPTEFEEKLGMIETTSGGFYIYAKERIASSITIIEVCYLKG